GCHGYRSEQGAESGFTQIRSIRSHLLSIFILEYRQTKWSRGFSHRSEPRIEISIELDDDVGRLSDSGGRKAAQRSGSVRSIPDSSSLGEGSWCCSRESNSRGLQRPHSSSTIRFSKSLSSVFVGPWTRIGRIRFCPILSRPIHCPGF